MNRIIGIIFLCSLLFAQTYQIPWWTINSGGLPGNATSYKLNGSIGQSSIGTGQSSGYKGSFGFWYGMELLPPVSDQWVPMANIPTGTSGKNPKAGSCMAGFEATGLIYFLKASNTQDFLIFTPNTSIGSWTSDTMPLGTKEAGDGKKPKRGAAMTAFNDAIFVLRGNNTNGFWEYIAIGDSLGWHKLQNIPEGAKKPKQGSGLVKVEKNGDDYIFAMKGSKTKEFYLYDLSGDSWIRVSDAPIGTSGKSGYKKGSCLCYDGNELVYVLQGYYGSFFSYSVEGDTWHQLKQYNYKTMLNRDGKKKKPKDGAALVYYNNNIYMLKGGNTNEVWMYSIAADSWSQMNPGENWDIPLGSSNKKVKDGGNMIMFHNYFYASKGKNTPEFYRHALPAYTEASFPKPTQEGVMGNKVAISGFRLTIAPNPVINLALVRYNLLTNEPVSYKLYDVCGKLVKSYINTTPTKEGILLIETKTLPAGVYLLRFNTGNTTITKKMVLEK